MERIFCNVLEPDYYKIAAVTNHKLSKIHKRQGYYYCKLDGKAMKLSEARIIMLAGVELYTRNNVLCKV